ncbi:hypothetical protein AFERRID_17970 [Acidithiobacillus ferridurans]|uniref:AmmeMemoRadiSam system protein B n=2 Tax=Acidithiobacillus ferridurans TaxID=1232575 RepID=A0A2Z6IJC9_ACIFI|nr:hypothetical protein AFERRID_17970 [Acidithiobacillus ferridurans]
MFYPGKAAVLRAEVERLLARAEQDGEAAAAPWPKAIIVPHAGYIYSGTVAASGYALLAKGGGISAGWCFWGRHIVCHFAVSPCRVSRPCKRR